jgi:hypothetical protein
MDTKAVNKDNSAKSINMKYKNAQDAKLKTQIGVDVQTPILDYIGCKCYFTSLFM